MGINFYTDNSISKPKLDERLLKDASKESRAKENAKIEVYKEYKARIEAQANAKKQATWNEVEAMDDKAMAQMHADEDAYYALNGDFSKYQNEVYEAKSEFQSFEKAPNSSGFDYAKKNFNAKLSISSNKEFLKDAALEHWKNSIHTAQGANNFTRVAYARLF